MSRNYVRPEMVRLRKLRLAAEVAQKDNLRRWRFSRVFYPVIVVVGGVGFVASHSLYPELIWLAVEVVASFAFFTARDTYRFETMANEVRLKSLEEQARYLP